MTLLHVALCAISCVIRGEGLGAVVTCAAEFTVVDVFHGDGISALFHLEDSWMAIRTFESVISMNFAAEHDLASSHGRELNCLAGRYCECSHRESEHYYYCDSQYKKIFHSGFTSFRIEFNKHLKSTSAGCCRNTGYPALWR